MLKKFQDMGKLLKQAQEMKGAMSQVQQELKATKIPSVGMGGKIKIELNGELDVLSVSIDPSLLDASKKGELEKGVQQVFKEGITKAKDLATSKLSAISGGLMPGQ